jgi:hypothetical protein
MKVDLTRREIHLIKLWWLSCEDMMIPEGTCEACEFKEECEIVRKKLYGKNGAMKKHNQHDKMDTLNTVELMQA